MTDAPQVRWLVAGPMCDPPTGKRWTLDAGGVGALLERERFRLEVPPPASLGDAAGGAVALEVPKLRALTAKAVLETVPALGALAGAASALDRGETTAEELVARLPEGPLRAQVQRALGAEAGAAGDEGAGTAAAGEAGADALFDKADVPRDGGAAAAIDAFVKQIGGSPRKRAKGARKLRDAVETAAYGAARDVLASEPVRRFEASWRGLDLLARACGTGGELAIEVHDVPLGEVPGLLEGWRAEEPSEEPDAVLVPFAVDDPALLGALANAADGLLCPLLVEVSAALFGASAETLPEVLENQKPQQVANAEWLALRQEEASRWLCAVTHRIVLLEEGAGAARREVLGSGVWAVGAMMSASYRATGSFAAIGGRAGGLQGPAVRTLTAGRHEGAATPTESFYSVRAQTTLAHHGLLAVGSARNSDRLMLSAAPMVRAAADAMPLPAQLLSGRIVRFARWMAAQVPADADSATVGELFDHAAKVFLFPGLAEGAALQASLRTEGSSRTVAVRAQVHPALAGLPFEIEFDLPAG